MERFRAQGSLDRKKGKFKFKNKLLSLDSSTITLSPSLFPWAEYKRAKGTATTCPALSCSPRPRWPMSPWPRDWL
ncbi:hypothetical protein DFAR_2000017 [Desulfarculales bacterium]